MTITAKELAALLTGREYGNEITSAEEGQAKADGLVVVYGYSDDNMEFAGAIHDEVGCYDGGTAYLTRDGLLQNECENDDCPSFARLKACAATIEALWCEEPVYSWTYRTTIPHETFEIVEDGAPFCRGIVFSLAEVPA
jgi:hypothetical protein